ncbi:DMT family transporter [Devosia psychrophila]|uniref:Permease of the drug/metabolite transporter (DMT) superfamily n=1 Tax=Devosia psychrophila TaxID=728005 RepID=A0A1I1RL64_9HYPH|nr:DMT family transporter [Devosia psychrophila]SFD33038.1 Permease of the drug/metabolite transporter (DMT) superfamily [Devosia psychrophila]
MFLVTVTTVLVKLGGATLTAVQMVFIRSLIGLVTVLPLAWRHRHALRQTRQWGRNSFRVLCSTLALSANFAALTALPLALVNAIGFMRPLVVLALATWLLGKRSGPWRWIGAAVGFAGVIVMVGPSQVAWNLDLAAALAMVVFGSLATVQTRAPAGENTTVLMVFYTVGLTFFTAVPALFVWQPVASADWPLLLAICVLVPDRSVLLSEGTPEQSRQSPRTLQLSVHRPCQPCGLRCLRRSACLDHLCRHRHHPGALVLTARLDRST